MDYRFIRQLLHIQTPEAEQAVCDALRNAGMEVFTKMGEECAFQNLPPERKAKDGDIYVSAADLERAQEIVRELGYGDMLAANPIPGGIQSEVEKAEEAYYKKRKWLYVECLVIVAAAVVYLLFRAI